MERLCQECGARLKGRIDQKFCNDHCRNTYNNRLYKDENIYMIHVGRILRKNRRILKDLNPNGETRARKTTLLSQGFMFKYFTSIGMTKEGHVCFFCYEYGYQPLENEYFALIISKEV
jgi:hypothetical protein